MPVDVRWDTVEPDVLLVVYTVPWNWQDYQDGMKRCTELLEARGVHADVIADVSQAGLVPKNALSYLRHGVTRNRPANLDKIVLVGIPSLAALLIQTLRRLYPGAMQDILEAPTLEDARKLLVSLCDKQPIRSDSQGNTL